MAYLLTVSILLLAVISIVYLDPTAKLNANNYGPFTMSIDYYGACKGPKTKNVSTMTTTLNKQLNIGIVNISFLVDAKIDEIKIYVHNIKESQKTFMWNYKLNDPCKHFAIASLINQFLKATNCMVKKGYYSNEVNFGEVMSSFTGNAFFYGTYSYKADLTSKKGNIACFNTTITFKKKI